MTTELTIPERASRALGPANIEATLTELAERSKSIVVITNPAGYDQCHAARMSLKAQRVEIERRGKLARDDANQFSKAVIAEEKRLVALIEPEEKRLQALQKAHDDAIEAEKQAKIAAELARVNGIQSRIAAIRAWPVAMTGKPASLIEQTYRTAMDYRIDESFAEFAEPASATLADSITALAAALGERQEFEAEQARVKAERAELDRLRAEQAQRDAEAKAARDAEDAERRQRIAREDAEIAARRAKVTAEIDRQEREQAEAKARERAEAEAALKAMDLPSPKPVMPAKPSDSDLARAVAGYYAVDHAVADYWLKNYGRMTRAA